MPPKNQDTPPHDPFGGLASDIEGLLNEGSVAPAAPTDAVLAPTTAQGVSRERILEDATRSGMRVVRITYEDVLTLGSEAQVTAQLQGELFEELHIIVATTAVRSYDVLQLAPKVWAYPTNSKAPWKVPFDVYRIAREQLFFAGTFRADVVVVDEPYELGIAGWYMARTYERGLHVTAHELPDDAHFLQASEWNPYRALLARFVIPRAGRVRVLQKHIGEELTTRYPSLSGRIDLIPRFYDVAALSNLTSAPTIRERYPSYRFLLVLPVHEDTEGRYDIFIDAASHALRQYPSVGLLILNAGSRLASLKQYAAAKGIAQKVVFETVREDDMLMYLRSADVLCIADEISASDTYCAIAGALGIPVLGIRIGSVDTLFTDGVSGITCTPGDLGCLIKGINRYMGDGSFRTLVATNARAAMTQRAGDRATHAKLYRTSIEQTLLSTEGREGVLESVVTETTPTS